MWRMEKLLSAVEDFSPQPSPNPADFSDSDRDDREEEEPLGFGERILLDAILIYALECRVIHQYFQNIFQEMLNCKIKLIKTAKLLFDHCWAIYCHIGKDKNNTHLTKKPKKRLQGHFKVSLHQRFTTRPNGYRESCSSVNSSTQAG